MKRALLIALALLSMAPPGPPIVVGPGGDPCPAYRPVCFAPPVPVVPVFMEVEYRRLEWRTGEGWR